MRRWMKVVFCFLFGIIFTNMFTMDQAVADESFGKREISAESSVLTQKKQAVLDMETMTFSLESEADEDGDTISKGTDNCGNHIGYISGSFDKIG